jgi:2-keto-4-pentenoate hydratase/2-oxohepta-3-ene-1,7-dioic acid hydratase in catechol pathway
MKIVRFEDTTGNIHYGELLDRRRAKRIEGDIFASHRVSDETLEIKRLLAPIVPVNIIAIGLNYRKHAEESGARLPDAPLIFVKLTTSVIGPEDPIVLPEDAPDEVDYEAELAVIIGRTARKVTEQDALRYVLGYTCANDVSARDCQRVRDRQWARAKGFDTFCPLGPALLVDPDVDPNALPIRARLNGEHVQNSNTSDMIFPVRSLICYLSNQFTLLPGTVILTGTPEGVGCARTPPVFLHAGDRISIEIDGIGELVNPVARDEPR